LSQYPGYPFGWVLALWTKNRRNLDETWTVGQIPGIKEPYPGHIAHKIAVKRTIWTKTAQENPMTAIKPPLPRQLDGIWTKNILSEGITRNLDRPANLSSRAKTHDIFFPGGDEFARGKSRG
jgi:hypothetical protein